MIKKFIFFIVIVCVAIFTSTEVSAKDTIDDLIQLELPSSIENDLSGIDISDYEGLLETLNPQNVFEEISALFKSGLKKPLQVSVGVIALLLTVSVLKCFKPHDKLTDFALTLGIISMAVFPTVSVIKVFNDLIKSFSVFTSAFIPVMAGIIAAKGKVMTATNFSTLMLIASEGVSYISSFVVIPLSGMQLSINIGGSFVDGINTLSLSRGINKASMWILSTISALFLGVLGLQTLISAPADNVSAKAIRFAVGTAVPVVGNVVSEALGTFAGSMKLLSSSAAVYFILAIFILILPVIIDIMLWRFSMIICRCAAELLSLNKAAELIKSSENCFSLLLGISILLILIFVISVAVVSIA